MALSSDRMFIYRDVWGYGSKQKIRRDRATTFHHRVPRILTKLSLAQTISGMSNVEDRLTLNQYPYHVEAYFKCPMVQLGTQTISGPYLGKCFGP